MAKSKTSKRYAREFRQEVVGLHRAGRFVRTTVSDPKERWAPDLVARRFTVRHPNRL